MPGSDLVFSIAMLAAGALVWGGVVRLRRGGEKRQGWLMIACAAVLVGNVLIWTL